MHAYLQRVDHKKFPKTPSDLWKPKGSGEVDILAQGKALKAMLDKEKRRRARRAPDVTIRREE
jgi:hypothetical protein